ncbi:MAG: hypothetical protein QXJ06_00410 [Candidatus Aenigmatarchaeota archaeon]
MKSEANITIYLVLGVILIFIGVLFYSKVKEWSCFINPFFCYKSKLQIAVECSYYRCIKGCESPIIEKLKLSDFECKSFCPPEWRDSDEKICNEKSYEHPVIVKINDNKKYNKEDFDVECIFLSKKTNLGWLEKLWESFTKDRLFSPKYIYIKEDIIKNEYLTAIENRETCIVGWTPFKNTLKTFSLKSGTVQIFTNHRKWLAFSSTTNYIWDDCCSDCSCETKDRCNQCALENINQCYFDTNINQCFYKDNIPCIDGKDEDICFNAAKHFCKAQFKELVFAGCISNKCEFYCGYCDDVKDQSYFPSFSFCIKNRCPSFDYESVECCQKINSCSDYKTSYECEKNLCFEKIGNCQWNIDRCENK